MGRDVVSTLIMTPGGPAVVRPDSVAELADAVRAGRDRGDSFRIRGAGTWLHGGRPCAATTILDVSALSGVVEYVPGDLTLTARAGTTLEEIDQVTRRHGQWLSLDPVTAPGATLGATLATASAGPLAATVGRPRDLTLGLEVVTGEGEVIRGGGRVVKNVAGFDLVRPHIGAWGTLGVLTEATVRLRARPSKPSDATLLVRLDSPASVDWNAVAARGVEPQAAELLDSSWSDVSGSGSVLLIRLAGNQHAVAHQARVLGEFGEAVPVTDEAWAVLRRPEPEGVIVLRLSARPSAFAFLWDLAAALGSLGILGRQGSPLRGVVRCVLRPDPTAPITDVCGVLASLGARVLVETAPEAIWSCHAADAHATLSSALRRAFDPGNVLNPGMMGGAP